MKTTEREEDHVARQREVEEFWLDVVELPVSSLRKSIVNAVPRSSGAIQEYGGFNRDEWLD